MYYPFLHGMQAELQAVSASAGDFGKPQQIFPVVEPVRAASKLKKELGALKTAGAAAYVIINPSLGDLATSSQVSAWSAALSAELSDASLVRPVFHERSGTTGADLAAFVAGHPGRKVGIVLSSSKVPPADVASAVGSADVLVFLRHGVSAAAYTPSLTSARLVEIHSNFNVLDRNSDYAGEEWFSGDHINFKQAGQAGFSDYTVLSDRFLSGGGPVGAAAFHLTFEHASTHHFWVQHFVSDETDRNVGTVSTKLLEAISHLNTQLAATPARFHQSPGLVSYQAQFSASKPTNLAKSKQLQIQHHLFTVARNLNL